MERRNSNDERPPQQPSNPNVFADDYALDPDEDDFMPSVSDGFRPAGVGANETWNGDRQGHDRSDSQRPPLTTPKPADNDLRRIASRNSTMKPPCGRESISHDPRNPGTHHNRGPSSQATAALQHRESISSTASFATMARSESPFGVGPSHPYGMYPQNTMARTSSVTTSSTQRQPHRSVSLQRPTHPYGMYTQNVEDEPPVPPAPPAIPVGFPGINTNYHRQIGPDGEEQDILGPDGHTEQLPPYSRYPEEGPTKAAMAAEASATPVEAPAAAPLNASDDTLLSPVSPTHPSPPSPPQQQQQQQETQNRDPPPPPAPPAAASTVSASEKGVSEKPETSQNATSWRSKKVLGRVPMGVALVLLVLVLIFAIILGAAIGTYVAKNKDKDNRNGKGPGHKNKDEPSPQVTGPNFTLFDATPIPTPPSLPPLPSGDFALPLGIAQESSPSCLTAANQLSAWSCKMTFAPLILTINNTNQPGAPPTASLLQDQTPDGIVQYGLQPPLLGSQDLQLVMDLDYKAFGPAYHFNSMYDKLVILNPDEFAAGASLSPAALRKREDKPPFRHRFQVVPGDLPWYCYWNQTYIEGYIYVTDDSSAASFTNFPTNWPTNPYGSSVPVETGAPATAVGSGSSGIATPTPNPVRKRGDGDYMRKPPYPRIVKIEERRLPSMPQPYCQRMRLMDDGKPQPALDSSQNPIIVYLQEDDPSIEEFEQAAGPPPGPSPTSSATNTTQRRNANLEKRRDPAGACHCQWMFQ